MAFGKTITLAALAALISGSLSAAALNFKGYPFSAEVLRGGAMRYREYSEGGKVMLQVRPDEEYAVILHNPLPVRVGVALSVDGLNSIDGARSTPRASKKWIIEPYGSVTINGWQTDSQSARKFVFTRQDSAYAQWRENREGRPYSENLGVIGVAWFWNKQELEQALHPPKPFEDDLQAMNLMRKSARAGARAEPAPAAAASAEGRAGTGMGNQESHPVTQVEFDATDGMFSVRDVLKIYYQFAKQDRPMPFVGEEEENLRFAPEMPK